VTRLISSLRTAPVASLAALVTRSAASVGNRAPAVLRRSERRRFSSASDEEVGGLKSRDARAAPQKDRTHELMLLQKEALLQRTRLLGPAFVAAVAYVDPGNVATNTQAGAAFGYLLLWVLVGATLMAGLVQYLSAKVGWLTGETLPALVSRRNSTVPRIGYWIQAELVATATDLAEIVGGAVALNLLFGLPLVSGALITTAVSTGLLFLQNTRSQQTFERVITGMLAIVTIGFLAGLVASPPDPAQAVAGLVPRLDGAESAILAVGMLGATVMPHAIYLHSALIRDRHGRADPDCAAPMLRSIRLDVGLAMLVAGTVNVGMLLLAASTLFGLNIDGLQAAHSAIGAELGPVLAGLFALALLASGLASTSVGGYAGAVIMDGLLHRRIPILWRRVLTAVPALILLALGLEPTRLLILSQVILSFGIPFALVPLVRIASDPDLMHLVPTRRATIGVAWLVIGVVTTLNVILIVLTVAEV
jgi:manganese transport protein